MAIRSISKSDTLETFRQEFNALAKDDFGDIANLSGAISANNLVDAMNETISIATSTAGWTIADDTSTTQIVGGGDTLTVLGTANQIQTVVSPQDTITFSFPKNVTIPNSLTALGTTHTFGTVEISGNSIRSVDTNMLSVLDTLRVSQLDTGSGLLAIDEASSIPRITSSAACKALTFDAVPLFNESIEFDGTTAGTFKTTVTATDPTANNTITIPDVTGTLITAFTVLKPLIVSVIGTLKTLKAIIIGITATTGGPLLALIAGVTTGIVGLTRAIIDTNKERDELNKLIKNGTAASLEDIINPFASASPPYAASTHPL